MLWKNSQLMFEYCPLMLGGPHGVVRKQSDDVGGLPIDVGDCP